MSRSFNRIAAAAAMAIVVLTATALPAAAYTIKGEGLYARYSGTPGDGNGIFMVDRTGSSQPRLHAIFVGLLPFAEQDAVARSIGCGGTPAPGNLVFSVEGTADADGVLMHDLVLSPSIDFGAIKSVWIDADETPTCSISFNFEKLGVAAGDVNGDGAAGLINSNSLDAMALVERRPFGQARLTIIVNGLDGNDEISVRGVNRACGTVPTRTAFTVEIAGHGFKSKTVAMSQAQINGLRSLRVTNVSTGERSCAPLSIIAILIGL